MSKPLFVAADQQVPATARHRLLWVGIGLMLAVVAVSGGVLLRLRAQREAAANAMIAGHVALLANRLGDARSALRDVDPSQLPPRALEQYVNDLALTNFRLGDWKSQLELADRARNDPAFAVRRLAPFILVDGLVLAGNDRALVHVVDSITTVSSPTAGATQRLLARAMERASLFGFDAAARALALAFVQVSEQERDSTSLSVVYALHLIGRDDEAMRIADSIDARNAQAPPPSPGTAESRSASATMRAIAHLWAGDTSTARAALVARRADAIGQDLRGTAHVQAASIAAQLGMQTDAIALLREVVPGRLNFQGGWPESVLLRSLRAEPEFKALIAPR